MPHALHAAALPSQIPNPKREMRTPSPSTQHPTRTLEQRSALPTRRRSALPTRRRPPRETLHPRPQTLDPNPCTLNPACLTRRPQPSQCNLTPDIRIPKPRTQNPSNITLQYCMTSKPPPTKSFPTPETPNPNVIPSPLSGEYGTYNTVIVFTFRSESLNPFELLPPPPFPKRLEPPPFPGHQARQTVAEREERSHQ